MLNSRSGISHERQRPKVLGALFHSFLGRMGGAKKGSKAPHRREKGNREGF